jgi:ubiquinone/menaquinone biosynthesis C-methylase UbiE
MPQLNAQYNVAAPNSLPVRIAGHMRRRMFDRFMAACHPAPDDTVLDIGVTGDRSYDHSNYLEAWYPHKSRITAIGLDDASFLEREYPGLRFVQADGRRLPFADRSFDFVHASAVLEHVGARAQQRALVAEALRVARRGVFLTTPNRWFPVEFHSVLPLVHWLPKPAFRAILRRLGHTALAEEANLNLLTRGELAAICRALGVADFSLDSVSLAGWPTNLILTARIG